MKRGSRKHNSNGAGSEDGGLSEQQALGFRRKDIVDAGHQQLKTLNRLDVELNEILANVLKEENRQRLLMQSLLKLIDKNKDQFFSAEEVLEAEEDWIGIMSGNRKDRDRDMHGGSGLGFSRAGSTKSLKIVTKHTGPSSPVAEPSPAAGPRSLSAKMPAPFSSSNSANSVMPGIVSVHTHPISNGREPELYPLTCPMTAARRDRHPGQQLRAQRGLIQGRRPHEPVRLDDRAYHGVRDPGQRSGQEVRRRSAGRREGRVRM
jgi:hypothetical protein